MMKIPYSDIADKKFFKEQEFVLAQDVRNLLIFIYQREKDEDLKFNILVAINLLGEKNENDV